MHARMTPWALFRSASWALGTAVTKAWALGRCARRRRGRRGSWLWGCCAKDSNHDDIELALPLTASPGMETDMHIWEPQGVGLGALSIGTSSTHGTAEDVAVPGVDEHIKLMVPAPLVESPRPHDDDEIEHLREVCWTMTPAKSRTRPATSAESPPEQPSSSTQDLSPLTLSPATCSEALSLSRSSSSPPCSSSRWDPEDIAPSVQQALFLSMTDEEHPRAGVVNEVLALSRRVARHQVSWPSQATIDVEDHLCRAPDIPTFEFLDRRDRVFRALAELSFAPAVDVLVHDCFDGEVEQRSDCMCDGKFEQPAPTVAVSPGRRRDVCIDEEPPGWPRWKIASFAHREAVRYDRRRRRTTWADG